MKVEDGLLSWSSLAGHHPCGQEFPSARAARLNAGHIQHPAPPSRLAQPRLYNPQDPFLPEFAALCRSTTTGNYSITGPELVMSTQASLGAAADERKARLAKYKNLKRKQPVDEIATPEGERPQSPPQEPDVSTLHLSGRNYDHETRGPKLGFEAPPTLDEGKQTLEQQAAGVEERVREEAAQEETEDKGIDLFKLQPKKPNWDLKRDLEKKTDVLNVRTDNAIARLVRERISGAQKEANKASGATNGSKDGDAAGVDGIALVEGLRVREREEEEEERREREEEAALGP